MTRFFLAALLLGGSAMVAHAESFTFRSTATTANAITVTVGVEKPVAAAFSTSRSQTTMASGRKLNGTSSCAGWSERPGGIFQNRGVCNFTDEAGGASILFGCGSGKDASEGDCVGRLIGTSGAYTGKFGNITWHDKNSADGKTGEAWGEGHWND